jgi:hypothetical protein
VNRRGFLTGLVSAPAAPLARPILARIPRSYWAPRVSPWDNAVASVAWVHLMLFHVMRSP